MPMTEAEWLAGADSVAMLRFRKGAASDRKLRLYMCGGCRVIWPLLYAAASRESVAVAERFADGAATDQELDNAHWSGEVPTFGNDMDSHHGPGFYNPANLRALVGMGVLSKHDIENHQWLIGADDQDRLLAAARFAEAASSPEPAPDWVFNPYRPQIGWPGAWLAHCVFGNPFRPSALEDRIRTSTAVAIAEAIYTDRAFDRLPILADALEDAGCTDAAILDHCRQPGEHARGCWVVDLVLGKS